MLYKHILAGTDFQELGDHAVARAVALATETSAKLTLVHVVDEIPAPNPLYAHYAVTTSIDQQHEALGRARTELERRIPAEARAAGLDARVEVRIGDAATEIVQLAQGIDADLIVVSTHGRRGFSNFVLGTVSERVVRLARSDVLIVR